MRLNQAYCKAKRGGAETYHSLPDRIPGIKSNLRHDASSAKWSLVRQGIPGHRPIVLPANYAL